MAEELIYKSITAVMAEIGAVGKTSKNLQQGFMYRGIDAVMNALNPALVKHKIFVVPEILEQTREERQSSKGNNLISSVCKIRYTFYAEDGSSIQAIVIGEGMDSGDKATNKAMSIAFKYACFQVFCIPTEEMVDPDGESHETRPKGAPAAGKAKKSKDKAEAAGQIPDEQDATKVPVNSAHIATIRSELARTGIDEQKILKLYSVNALEKLNMSQFMDMMNRFKITKSKEAQA